jgi:hypothetical protein
MAKLKIVFSVFEPAVFIQAAQIEEVFGEYYKYDFPRWCKENKYRCFYKPETRVYIVLPSGLIEQ